MYASMLKAQLHRARVTGVDTEADARAHEPTVIHLDTRASRRAAADGG